LRSNVGVGTVKKTGRFSGMFRESGLVRA
jgi:hypothetical protein